MPTLLLREIRQNPFPINPKSRKLPPALFIIFSRQLIMTRYPFFRHPLRVFTSPPVRALMRYLSLPYRYARPIDVAALFPHIRERRCLLATPHALKQTAKNLAKNLAKRFAYSVKRNAPCSFSKTNSFGFSVQRALRFVIPFA